MDIENVDYIEEARGRITEQFKDKPNLDALMKVWLGGFVELQQVFLEIEKIKDIDESSGAQLDNIGVIVGQPRELSDVSTSGFFGFKTDPGAQPFGSVNNSLGGYYYSLDDPESGVVSLSDSLYSTFLKSKIIQNNAGTTPEEIIEITKVIFDTETVELYEGGSDPSEPAVFSLNVGRDWNDPELTIFPGLDETQVADRLIPKAAGVRIEYVDVQTQPTLDAVDRWVNAANRLYQVSNNILLF